MNAPFRPIGTHPISGKVPIGCKWRRDHPACEWRCIQGWRRVSCFAARENPSVPRLFFFSIKMPSKSSQSGVTTLKGAQSLARSDALANPWLVWKRCSESTWRKTVKYKLTLWMSWRTVCSNCTNLFVESIEELIKYNKDYCCSVQTFDIYLQNELPRAGSPRFLDFFFSLQHWRHSFVI